MLKCATQEPSRSASKSQTSGLALNQAEEGAAKVHDAVSLYLGMTWTADPLGAPQMIGVSDVLPFRFLIDMRLKREQGGPVEVLEIYSDAQVIDLATEWLPHRKVATARSLEEAVDFAELRDFQMFRAGEEAAGRRAAFRGSARREAVGQLELEVMEEEVSLYGDPEQKMSPDGRVFARAASYFEAKKSAMKQNADGSKAVTFVVGRGHLPLWLDDMPLGDFVLMGAVCMETSEEDPQLEKERKEIADLVARAQLRPTEPDFQEFLCERYDAWGLIATASRIDSDAVADASAETLKRILGIPTRAHLKTNRDAQDRFRRLDQEFYFDMSRQLERREALHRS